MDFNYSYQTDVGLVRSHNEDAVQIFENENLLLMVVADGMGGHSAGDVAAKMVIDTFAEHFGPALSFDDHEAAGAWISAILDRINNDILAYAKVHHMKKMGTTLVAAAITQGFIVIANIGDSRAYIVAYNELRQVTKDHTFVRRLVEEGQISERAAKIHPQKNLIINALGANEILDFDLLTIEQVELQKILLCTDGLTGMVEDKEISELIKKDELVKEKVMSLIEKAKDNGGRDNISVALVEFKEGSSSK
jgi:protein phosphatase